MKKIWLVVSVLFLLIVSSSTTFARESTPERDGINPIPQRPIILDGERMEPKEIRRFDNRTLYYLVDDQANSDGVVYVFSTLEGIQDFAIERQQQRRSQVSSCQGYSTLYDTLWYGGSSLTVSWGNSVSFTGPYSGFNNDVGSVKTTSQNVYTKLFDNTNFTGSQLWLATCGSTPNLSVYGWYDRAGSVRVN